MITKLLAKSRNLKRRIEHRLRPIDWEDQESPMFSGTNIHYEVADKTRGTDVGGIGASRRLASNCSAHSSHSMLQTSSSARILCRLLHAFST